MLRNTFFIGLLATVLTFGFIGCSTGSDGGGDTLMDGTWRRGNLSHYYQIKISGSTWEYSEGAAGHILAYSNGTWVSSKDAIIANSNGILTLTTDQVYQGGEWQTYPETDYNLKTNAAWYTLNANANVLKIEEPILTTAGLWGTLKGDYEKQYEWGGWADANGGSTITLSDTSGTFAMSGIIAAGDDHWAGMGIFPTDTATQNAMKTAKSISFDIKGSGEYELILMTSDIQQHGDQTGEWLWYKRIFKAPATETTITLNIEDFLQEGTYMEFKQNLWEGIQFAPVWNSKGPFNLTFGNVKVSDTADGMALPDWRWDSNAFDGGTVTLTEGSDGKVTINGNNSAGGFDWWASPNNGKASNAIKNATTLSFKANGNGTFEIRLRTPWGDDHGEVYRQFTLNGTEQTITLNISDFTQDNYYAPFDQIKTMDINFHPIGNGTFSLTMSDLKMTGVKTPVTEWHGLKLPSTTKGLQHDIYDGKTDVLFISPNPKYDWHALEYDLYEYRGKKLKIDFSVEMKLTENGIAEWKIAKEGNDGWNTVNSNSRQILTAGTWYTISGNYTMQDALQEPYNFRLEGYNDEWPMLQNASAYFANFSITVTEVGAEPAPTPVTTWKGLTVPTATKALQYTTYDGKSDVLHIEPNGAAYDWNVLQYGLSSYVGKKVKFELTVDMKLESATKIVWNVNSDGYPVIAGSHDTTYTANTWHHIDGVYITQAPVETDAVLYLSKEQFGTASAYLANFTLTITEITGDDIVLALSNDSTGDSGRWEVHYRPDTLLNGYQITTGDTFTFTYSFKSDVAMTTLYIFLADNGNEANSYAWKNLSDSVTVQQPVVAGTIYTGTVSITATDTAVDASTMANKLVIQGNATTRPTLTFTTLTLEKNP